MSSDRTENADVPTSRVARTARFGGLVAGQGARWAGMRAANAFRSDERSEAAQAQRAMATANELVARLGEMKGAAMKLGQVLSTIDFDLIPEGEREQFKEKLAELRDDAPRIPFSKQRKLMEQELGGKLGDVFAEFDETPIAAASIGQVYRARTHAGLEVAVKVQYPGIAEAVETDLRNMQVLLPLVKRLAPGLDVKAIAAELRERIGEELDYEIEAQNQRRVARAFRGHPFIRVPAVDTALSTRRVLVTEFVEGRPFSAVKDLPEEERDRFAEVCFRFFYGLLTREEIAAGDPHPGNLLLAPDDKVVFLDFGLIRHVDPDYLEGERGLARAVVAGDADAVKASMAELGYLPDPSRFTGEDLLAQLLVAAEWYFDPQFRRLDPEYVRHSLEQGSSPRSPFFAQMRRQTVPAQALLIRRMEGLLFSVFGELRAGAHWHDLAQEYIAAAPPSTPLGLVEAAWLAGAAEPSAAA
ncbi:MAG: AarF/ABC1/UbiB kinase family protein [Solirubrobacterales bacterium]|nr:AarF/ABC1/UbiB kinase family protein [Solirubrobacterales bacterium]